MLEKEKENIICLIVIRLPKIPKRGREKNQRKSTLKPHAGICYTVCMF